MQDNTNDPTTWTGNGIWSWKQEKKRKKFGLLPMWVYIPLAKYDNFVFFWLFSLIFSEKGAKIKLDWQNLRHISPQ